MGPGDDAAVFADGLVLTTDALVQGVHFDERLDPADVGYKAVAVSASDIGAMGGTPRWAMLTLSLPAPTAATDWTRRMAVGLHEALAHFGIDLVGGDTTSSPGPIMVTVSMGGRCTCAPLTRGGCRAGDRLWVTGYPGLAAAGYLFDDPPPPALAALRRPTPPVHFATRLASRRLASAAMDLSDGLAADLPRLAAASGVGFALDAAALPRHPCLPANQAEALVLSGGDAYELVFTAPHSSTDAIRSLAEAHHVKATPIGVATAAPAVRVGDDPLPTGFAHFAGSP